MAPLKRDRARAAAREKQLNGHYPVLG